MIHVNASSPVKQEHSVLVASSGRKRSWACDTHWPDRKKECLRKESYVLPLDRNGKDLSFPKRLFNQVVALI